MQAAAMPISGAGQKIELDRHWNIFYRVVGRGTYVATPDGPAATW
jgi:hypothetical protein